MIHSPLGTADQEQEIDDDSATISESVRTTVAERAHDGTLALGIGGIALIQGVRTLRSDRNGSGSNLLLGGALVAIGLTQRRHRQERASSVTGSGTPDAEEIENESLERGQDGPGRGEGAGPFADGERGEFEFDADDALEAERDDDTREATTDVLDQIDDAVPTSDAASTRGSSAGRGRTGNTRPIAESGETSAPADDVPVDEDPSRQDEGKEAIGEGMTGEDDQEPMGDDAIGRAEDDANSGEREEVEDPARMEDLAEDLEDAEDENEDA